MVHGKRQALPANTIKSSIRELFTAGSYWIKNKKAWKEFLLKYKF